MSEDLENKKIEGHEYDGIQELDNPLPGWWLWTFLFTIMFGALYYLHYEIGGAPSHLENLASQMEEIEQMRKSAAPLSVPMETEEQLKELLEDKNVLALGKATFTGKCAACHGQDLEGSIGPNLTDKYWIHGKGQLVDILKVVREGVADKGMPGWNELLKKDEVTAVAAFVLSKKGSQPKNPKAPQGEPAN
jgi:cytochrome c oxidase cbb3-type subunit 3